MLTLEVSIEAKMPESDPSAHEETQRSSKILILDHIANAQGVQQSNDERSQWQTIASESEIGDIKSSQREGPLQVLTTRSAPQLQRASKASSYYDSQFTWDELPSRLVHSDTVDEILHGYTQHSFEPVSDNDSCRNQLSSEQRSWYQLSSVPAPTHGQVFGKSPPLPIQEKLETHSAVAFENLNQYAWSEFYSKLFLPFFVLSRYLSRLV